MPTISDGTGPSLTLKTAAQIVDESRTYLVVGMPDDASDEKTFGVELAEYRTKLFTLPAAQTLAMAANDLTLTGTGVFTVPNITSVGHVSIGDASNLIIGSTTGSKIGTASTQKIGLWNAVPVVQPSSTGTTTGFTAGISTPVLSDSTFTGGVGSTAYTIGDVVKHLKTIGIIAS